MGSIPGSGEIPSILAWEIPWTEEPGGLQCMVYEVAMSQKQLSDQTPPRSMEKEV